MQVKLSMVCTWCAVVLCAISCSGSNHPLEPGNPELPEFNASPLKDLGSQAGRSLMGYWTIRVTPESESVEIIPQRVAEMHLNTVRILEGGLCDDCLIIQEVEFLPDNKVSVMMVIRHPFPGLLVYTAFDVRGTVITGSGFDFPVSGKSIAWGDEVPRLLTYDGYTSLFNPTEFPETDPPPLGYIPGNKATGGDLSATLNPYVAFKQDEARCIFGAGEMAWRFLQLYVPSHPIEFGYAIDVCWQLVEEPIFNPVYDFPPDANSLEAYKIDVHVGNGIEAGGGSAPINVKVFDHQGLDTIESVTAESPDLFSGIITLSYSGTDPVDGSHMYTGNISNDYAASFGEYPLLIRVIDIEADQNLGQIDAWQVYVLPIKRGWARTWGGGRADTGYDSAISSTDILYVTGSYTGTVDFDPGMDVESHTSQTGGMGQSTQDCFISSFDTIGNYQWVLVWGGGGSENGYSIDVDDAGNIYVTGYFTNTMDFDPGAGEDEHTPVGSGDVYLSKFDSTGNFEWARTWGGAAGDLGFAVTADNSDGVYVTGIFQGTVDFDPGVDEDLQTSNGSFDVFCVKFDSTGAYQWANTWGGSSTDSSPSVATDSLGQVYVSGSFRNIVDFDPGPGSDMHTSVGNSDVFLTMFDTSGSFVRAYTWGSTDNDYGDEVAVYGPGNVYCVGTFRNTADLDPTGGSDVHIPQGTGGAFISKFDPAGAFQWAKSWGGISTDYPLGVVSDGFNNAFVTGKFSNTSDFDPGPGVDSRTSYGMEDVFLSKFDSSGNYLWAQTWGGIEEDYSSGIVVDTLGNAYIAGNFSFSVDFDATSGNDQHESNGLRDIFLCKYPPDGIW